MSVYERIGRLREWLWVPACALCGAHGRGGYDFCDGCEKSLPLLTSCCSRCAIFLPGLHGDSTVCGECQQHPPKYQSAHAAFRYAPPVDRLIHGAKYTGRLDWLAILGRRLAQGIAARAGAVDALVAVPLHHSRLRERGYNQSLELARPLAKQLGLPLRDGLERLRATPPQATLTREERRRNVRAAFAARSPFTGLRVALVDDVMTSGATVDAAARCLRKAGAASVEVWVVARA